MNSKTASAMNVLMGFEDAVSHWRTFFDEAKPDREDGEGMLAYRSRLARRVHWAASAYVTAQLERLDLLDARIERLEDRLNAERPS